MNAEAEADAGTPQESEYDSEESEDEFDGFEAKREVKSLQEIKMELVEQMDPDELIDELTVPRRLYDLMQKQNFNTVKELMDKIEVLEAGKKRAHKRVKSLKKETRTLRMRNAELEADMSSLERVFARIRRRNVERTAMQLSDDTARTEEVPNEGEHVQEHDGGTVLLTPNPNHSPQTPRTRRRTAEKRARCDSPKTLPDPKRSHVELPAPPQPVATQKAANKQRLRPLSKVSMQTYRNTMALIKRKIIEKAVLKETICAATEVELEKIVDWLDNHVSPSRQDQTKIMSWYRMVGGWSLPLFGITADREAILVDNYNRRSLETSGTMSDATVTEILAEVNEAIAAKMKNRFGPDAVLNETHLRNWVENRRKAQSQ